jgi:hypothetical protein
VFGYWLVSGYGLRATRALGALVILVAVATLAFQAWGFTHDPSHKRAFLYSMESTSSLLRKPHAAGLHLTEAGEIMQMGLRFAGPLLIGLMLLALRARVKR